VTDFLSEKRKEIDGRLRELRPLVDEYHRLERAASALSGLDGGGGRASRGSAGTQRRAGGRRRRGRPRGSGKRAIQALELVNANPGISITELADRMGIKANYLYRVMPTLQKEGKVRKRGRGWHPA
jgi:winged helix-turn-helix DNA-binding protein